MFKIIKVTTIIAMYLFKDSIDLVIVLDRFKLDSYKMVIMKNNMQDTIPCPTIIKILGIILTLLHIPIIGTNIAICSTEEHATIYFASLNRTMISVNNIILTILKE